MSEAILAKEWLPQVERAFERLKAADTAEREEWCQVIREDEGPKAEADLRAKLAAHDQAMQAKPKSKPWRRDLNRANAAPCDAIKVAAAPIRDTLDVAAKRLDASEAAAPAIELPPSTALVPFTPKPEPLARFAGEAPKTNDGLPPLLSLSSPYDTAKEYARRYCFYEGMLATYFWQSEFWEWNGRYYEVLAPEIIRDRVYAFLDGSQRRTKEGEERFKPTPKLVNDVFDALKAGLVLPAKHQPPMWLDTGKPANDVFVFRNELVNLQTGDTIELTPKLWVHSAVDYDHDQHAKCPVWERFLEEVFPSDKASQDFIEEWLGYGMTEETKFEKAAMWIGEKRSGKGTIAFVQRKLIGDGAYVGLSFSTWLTNENSPACMIGKRVGVFPDIRFKPGKAYGASYDAGGITHTSTEMLLKIIGSDTLTLGRKYLGAWHGQLRLKLTLISNVVLNFNDTTLPWRFIKINFTQSFFGKEDVDLRDKLVTETSGIANRCMTAYRRLVAKGRFIQPQSGLDLERKVIAESDPYTAFVNDVFVIDPVGMVDCGQVKIKFNDWCRERGRFDVLRSTPTASLLTQRLKGVAGLEGLGTYRQHGKGRSYVGLRLKTKTERE